MAQETYIARKGQDADFAALTADTLTLGSAYPAPGDAVNFTLGASEDVALRFSTADASNHTFVVALDDTSQQVHITDKGAVATDWNRSAGTHPEVSIHSNTTPATDYLAIGNHDGTTASIDVVGGTTLALKIAGTTAASLTAGGLAVTAASGVTTVGPIVKLTQTVGFADFTDGLGTSGTIDLTVGTIPAGATFLYSAVTAVTGFAGDTSAVLIIGDGTDHDRYNTGTINVFATAAAGVAAGAPSGVVYHDAAKTVKLTVTGAADFTSINAGSVTVELYYLT
jgi:hypothetical protein